MTRWEDRIANSSFMAELRECQSALAVADKSLELAPEAAPRLARIRRIVMRVAKSVEAAEAELVSIHALEALRASLASVRQEVSNFAANRNIGHFDNADSYADALLSALPQILPPDSKISLKEFKDALATYTSAVEPALATFKAQSDSLSSTLETLAQGAASTTAEVNAQKSVLANAVTAIQNQFQQEQESRAKQFLAQEDSRSAEHRSAVADRAAQTAKATEEQRLALSDLLADARSASDRLRTSLEADAKTTLEHLGELKAQAERLLGIVGTTTIISGYKREADISTQRAKWWNVLSVVGIVGFTAGTVYGLLPTVRGDVVSTWETLASRIVLSLALGVLGTFAARQARYNEGLATRNRRFELELSSIGPFIAELDPNDRTELKKALVARLFGQPESVEKPTKDQHVTGIVEVVKTVLQNLPASSK